MADLKNELIFVRVLEHTNGDQIKIGASYPVFKQNLDKEVKKIKEAYNRQLDWCGGWTEENNNKYHERIALVDADTLQSVKEIWKKKRVKK